MKKRKFKKLLALALATVMLTLAVIPMGAGAEAPSVTLPSELTSDGSYDSHGDSKVYYYKGVSKTDYDDYISTLKGEGYTEQKTYNADDCYYSLLDNGTNTIFVSFLRSVSGESTGRLRVFVQASGTPYHTQSAATEANVCEPKLWQLDVDNTSDDGGMGYVIRLTDGTFMVIDGGYRNDNRDADNLYSILVANNPLEGKPVISAWFITHLHEDHYGCFDNFTDEYINDVIVLGFYYNFPSAVIGDINKDNDMAGSREDDMKKWTGAKLYSKIHSGMVMGFAGATVEVLATHEDIMQSYYTVSWLGTASITSNNFGSDGNETSTVFRVNIAGQSIMFLADAEQAVSNAMLHTYTSDYLKADIMQMAHHGFDDTVSADLIEAIAPEVVLWPQDIIRYADGVITVGDTSDTKTFICYYNKDEEHTKAVKNTASEVIPAYKNEELSLPYEANTLYKSKTPDVENLAKAKVELASVTVGTGIDMKNVIYLQRSDDKTKLRIVGVLNLDEADFDKYESFGFDITMKYGGKTYKGSLDTTTVYTSIVANGETVYANDPEYGGTHFYAIEITDVGQKDIDFVISGTGTCIVNGSTYKLAYDTVTYSINEAPAATGIKIEESGEVKSFDFNAIIAGAWEKKNAQ